MSQIAIVYWSGTGNTQEMAELIASGIQEAGGESVVHMAWDFTPELAAGYDKLIFGCPAMGDEVLEEEDFAPMWKAVKPVLKGKKIALFGSYSWNSGEWMDNWGAEAVSAGLTLAVDSVISFESPSGDTAEACRNLGKQMAELP